jgi:hypothetical protein
VDKRFEKCPRKNVDLDDWYETTARGFPEGRQRKTFSPEGPPTIDRASVGIEEFGEFPDSSRRRTLPHGGDQDDDSAEINLSAEKTDRPRSHPLAASVALAAEAMPPEVNSRQIIRPTPRLPRVVSPVQPPTARTGVLASSLGKFLINIGQKQPETSIANQIMVHRGVLRRLWKNQRSTPLKDRDQVIRLFEGTFFEYHEEVDRKTRTSPRLSWPRSLLVFVCICGWTLLPEQVKHTHQQLYEVIANS